MGRTWECSRKAISPMDRLTDMVGALKRGNSGVVCQKWESSFQGWEWFPSTTLQPRSLILRPEELEGGGCVASHSHFGVNSVSG